MTGFEFGDVVLVAFPLTNHRTSKQRPAVIVSSAEYNAQRPDILLLAITSQLGRSAEFGEGAIAGWREAGLIKPSVLKPLIATIEHSLVRRRLGRLVPLDRQTLVRILHEIIGG